MKLPDNTSCLRIGEPPGRARTVVILLHGRGSSAKGIARLADSLPREGVAYLAPSAAEWSWYPQRFLSPVEANEPALSRALGVVEKLVGEARADGIPEERIALVGFSQGACLALEYAARHPARYAFVAALSGALIGPHDAPARQGDLAGTPVLVACAEHDAHIPSEYVEKTVAELGAMGADVTRQVFDGHTHAVFPQEIRWLQEQLQGAGPG